MAFDIQTVMWKEWREIYRQKSSLRDIASLLIILAFFSLFFPTQFGAGWVSSPVVIFFSTWVPFLMVTSIVADSFAGERERHTLETLLASRLPDSAILLGKILATSIFGWLLALLILLFSLISVNLQYSQGSFLFYNLPVLLGSIVLGFLGALLSAQTGVIISLRSATVRQAQQILSLLGMAPVFLLVFLGQMMSAGQKAKLVNYFGSFGLSHTVLLFVTALAVADLILFWAARARFQRTRLILD